MIIVLRQDAPPREIKNLQDSLDARGTVTTVIRGEERSVIAVIGEIGATVVVQVSRTDQRHGLRQV